MSDLSAPEGLGVGGSALWSAVASEYDLDPFQVATLTEICRSKDRLDKLDLILAADVETWAKLTHSLRTEDYELRIDAALSQANSTANLMKQLIAALRLPDEHGKKPQARGPRGVQKPRVPGVVSSLDRARAAKSS